MRTTRVPGSEPLPGYRLLEPLGSGGFGEVWKCEAPGGLHKAIKFVASSDSFLDGGPCRSAEELRAIQRIKDLRHPFLLSIERVERSGNDLMIVMELADRSLHDLLQESRAPGRCGIDRGDLMGYLAEAAEVLDLMHYELGLQHLDVKPRNLFLVRGHVKVADFGLVQSLSDGVPSGASCRAALSAVTPLYAAPELFRGTLSERCDQYSLAIVFMEMLTGRLPFHGKNVRQLMVQHTLEPPDLDPLPAADRPIVARALAKDPTERFGSCMELVQALDAVTPPDAPRPRPRLSFQGRSRQGLRETKGVLSTASTVSLGPPEARYLPDYHFNNCLGRDPQAETWVANAPSGERRLVKFLYGTGASQGDSHALLRLPALRHPALPSLQVFPAGPGSLVLITDWHETSLRVRYQECQAKGDTGVPRAELIDRLESAAEALDQLYEQHGLQHLALNPTRVLLDGDRTLLADFGLAQLLWLPTGSVLGQAQLRYTSPELSQGLITRSCDQYSLALIYQEMLTGAHPFRGQGAHAVAGAAAAGREQSRASSHPRSSAHGRRDDAPKLQSLPEGDRAVIARALEPNPERRYPSCLDFVRALRSAGRVIARLRPSAQGATTARRPASVDLVNQLLDEAREWQRPDADDLPPPLGEGEGLERRFMAVLPPINPLRKFDGFCQQWNARVVDSADGWATFEVVKKTRRWLPWGAPSPTLRVEAHWARIGKPGWRSPCVVVRIRSGAGADDLLAELGTKLLDSMQTHLLGSPERRQGERVPWPLPVTVTWVQPDGQPCSPIECQGKDLSLGGMGLYLPTSLPTSQVELRVSTPARNEPVALKGSVVRIQRWDEQLFEVGVLFE